MYYFDNREHAKPHIHAIYAEYEAILEKVVPHPDCCVDRCSKSSSRKLSGLRPPCTLGAHDTFSRYPSIPEGNVLSGEIPGNKLKLITAWIEIHQEELMADWKLAVEGQQPFKIEPLR